MGGEVRRYHTWPTIRQQTNSDHTHNVMRIYWQVFGPLSSTVSSHLIWHDIWEVGVGDVPHPIKAHNPELARIYARMESETATSMLGSRLALEAQPVLTPVERARCKACDLLEMWEFAAVESALGSVLAVPIMQNTHAAINKLELSEADRRAVYEYVQTEISRFRREPR
jgi:5'-deoxynucleotidase YfbR-like HD superfamily hydrolase